MAACGTPVTEDGGCADDSACPGGAAGIERCDVASGLCLCVTDDACDGTEFCNPAGRCQPKAGCENNSDCKTADNPSAICDVLSGSCVTLNAQSLQCTLDSHCPFGSICENQICQTGCRVNGDCPTFDGRGQPCINNQCNPDPNACNGNHFCDYGEICNLSSLQCTPHQDAAFLCQSCTPASSLLDPPPCGNDINIPCLIDTSVPPQPCSADSQCTQWPGARCQKDQCITGTYDCQNGSACENEGFFTPGECAEGYCARNFCGSTGCNDASPCPKGYNCYTLITVTGNPCTSNSQCSGTSSCQIGGEGQQSGYCSCTSDADCPQQLDGAGGTCVNPGPNGACVTGTTCGPAQGLFCEDL
jgi:hypothetical protein